MIGGVLGSLEWALDQNVRVLSMSLGFRGYTPYFLRIIQVLRANGILPVIASEVLRANGILPVIASGNEGAGTSRSPGNYVESFSVGAMQKDRGIADFSSSQEFARPQDSIVPDVVGPGADILSAKPRTKGYQSMRGTSMATPHIAGLAALLFEAKPEATIDQVEAAIRGACGPLQPQDRGRAAAGMPDARRSLALLTGGASGGAGGAGQKGKPHAIGTRKPAKKVKEASRTKKPKAVKTPKKA